MRPKHRPWPAKSPGNSLAKRAVLGYAPTLVVPSLCEPHIPYAIIKNRTRVLDSFPKKEKPKFLRGDLAMRVVFLEDVSGVARGGDVKEVKNGFARNYLIPKNLAVPATHNALQRVERLGREADVTRVKRLEDMRALAAELDGMQVNVEMRAGSGGRLYGSVTNAMIAEGLASLTEREIDRRIVEIEEPIRQLGTFEVNVRLDAEVEAKIKVLVYPIGTDPLAQADAEDADTDHAETDDGEVTETAEVVEEPVAEIEPADSEADEPEDGSGDDAGANADEPEAVSGDDADEDAKADEA